MYIVFTNETSAQNCSNNVNLASKYTKNQVEISAQVIEESSKYYVEYYHGYDFSTESNVEAVVMKLPSQELEDYIKEKIIGAEEFCNTLFNDLKKENVLWGITQLGKTATALHFTYKKYEIETGVYCSFADSLLSGSITIVNNIIDLMKQDINSGTIDVGKFLSDTRLDSIKQKITDYLNG